MADPVSLRPLSVRDERPWTIAVGIGHPDMLRLDVTRTFADQFTVGGVLGIGPLGATIGATGAWDALRSPDHGHSLTLGAGLSVAPGIAQLAGNGTYLIADTTLGWEYRAPCGFTSRVAAGPALYTGFGAPHTETAFTPRLVGTLGWSF